jgi:hypothetical protein
LAGVVSFAEERDAIAVAGAAKLQAILESAAAGDLVHWGRAAD